MLLAHSRPAGKSGSIGWRRILNECSALGSKGFRWEPAARNLTEKGWGVEGLSGMGRVHRSLAFMMAPGVC